MGIYIYIDQQDRINMRKVANPELQELFNEALKYDESLMICEGVRYKKRMLFGYKEFPHYQIYHDQHGQNEPPFQARQQITASGSVEIVTAYLYGIINGALHSKNK